ncbi:hypothetical protein ZOSMA_9G01220 [Zostera marina]|uniref:DUF547 domain-containing protein n=1 Tax=Zostera marina TaxID=29655 RepID=A0A0K9NIV2_ZOSMR|nr:hypothetical protein ZOSMA_9G01220 [Zostera marina]
MLMGEQLRKEILQLEECLQDQFLMRGCLEKALRCEYTVGAMDADSKIPKAVKELIREIAVLELEVLGLEHHLLSLYRKILSNNVREREHHLPGPPQVPEVVSLVKCLGTRIADHVPETANRLSEDMVRCMGSIYWRLGDMGMQSNSNPFQVEGLRELGGPYNGMVQLRSFSAPSSSIATTVHVDALLEIFRSIVQRLQTVDVKSMKNEEKLAFWINVHNALVMHAHICIRIPNSDIQAAASCNIGGRIVSADIIKKRILRQPERRRRWMRRASVSPRLLLKLKKGNEDEYWQCYGIHHPEPDVVFAICSGKHSDPAVRVYHPKKIFQQLETAKQEYIRATVSVLSTVGKRHTILLPKMLESFAKDSRLTLMEMAEMIQLYLPETLRMAIRRCQVVGISPNNSCIDWSISPDSPHNFSFRYILSRDLAVAKPILTKTR